MAGRDYRPKVKNNRCLETVFNTSVAIRYFIYLLVKDLVSLLVISRVNIHTSEHSRTFDFNAGVDVPM